MALAVLVGLVVLSPWAMGGVDPPFTQAIAVLSLATALAATLLDGSRSGLRNAPIPLWPLACLWLLAAFQLLPLPEGIHARLAPGSAAVWHPDPPAAAAVLGPGPRPVSLHPEATRRSLALATGVIALALAAVPALRERRRLLRAVTAIVVGGSAVSVYALVARLAFGNRLYGVWSVPTVAPFGPFVNKNHFAGYVELVALLALGLASGLASEARRGRGWLDWIESRRARFVVAAWGAAVILVLAVPVSLSRGGVLSLTAGIVAFVALRFSSRSEARLPARTLLAVVAGGVLAVALLVAVLPAEARGRVLTLAGITSEQSGSFRLGVWRDSLRLAASSPWVGSGLGSFEDALRRFKTSAGHLAVEHAESDYLELLAETGFVGFLLAATLAVFVVTRGLHVTEHARERLARAVASGAVAGLVALAVHSAFDFNLHIPSNAIVAALLAAVVLAATGAAARRTPMAVTATVLAVTLATAVFAGWTYRRLDTSLARAAAGEPAGLRRRELDAQLASHVGRRPADAAAWLGLAWLRRSESAGAAAALATWARDLDPASQSIEKAAAGLADDPDR